jgi:RNA polymerase sigma-70 factor, ECF subfamily
MPSGDQERELIAQIAAGDERAIEAFDLAQRPYLERLARGTGIPAEDCRDLAQEVLFAAVQAIQAGRFRGDCSLKTFIIAILRNKSVDYKRKHGPDAHQMLTGESGTAAVAVASIEHMAGLPMKPELKLMTEQALDSMPEEHRLILLLNEVGGYTIREIGSMLGRSKGRVGALLAEAKKMFREKLR